jgi:gluconate kinase
MKPGMLASQLATLEEPACGPGTDAWCADLTLPVEAIVDQALAPGILW